MYIYIYRETPYVIPIYKVLPYLVIHVYTSLHSMVTIFPAEKISVTNTHTEYHK